MVNSIPRVKVFIDQNGNVENVYQSGGFVDVEIIVCDRVACRGSFENEYKKAEAEGFSADTVYKEMVVNES